MGVIFTELLISDYPRLATGLDLEINGLFMIPSGNFGGISGNLPKCDEASFRTLTAAKAPPYASTA